MVLSPILVAIYINDIPYNYSLTLTAFYLLITRYRFLFIRLVMGPYKCNNIIFNQQTKLKLKTHVECISYYNLTIFNSITFLGLRLDPFLSFKSQKNYLPVAFQTRLLSHKSCKII